MKTFKFEIQTNKENVSTMYAYRAHYIDKENNESYGKIYLSKDKVINEIDIYINMLEMYKYAWVDRLLIFV